MAKNGQPEIESGIPIPNANPKRGYSDLLRQLKVGQSVVLQNSSQACNALFMNIRRGTRYPCEHQFTARKIDAGHTRVWRVK